MAIDLVQGQRRSLDLKIKLNELLFGTKIGILYWRNYVKNGCAIAGLHCNLIRVKTTTVTGTRSTVDNHDYNDIYYDMI